MRVLLADDQPEVRSAIRLILEQEPGVCVVAEASRVDDMLIRTQTAKPDVVMLDWELSDPDRPAAAGGTVRQALATLRSLLPKTLVVALSGRPEARQAAVAAGVDGFVSKGDPPERLLATLRALSAGGRA